MRTVQLSNRHPRLKYTRASVLRFFRALDACGLAPLPEGDLSIVFLEAATVTELHAAYLNDPTPTDVITFPGDEAMAFSGELCVSVDCAYAVAPKHKNSFAQELSLYLVHGWLHLAGYDDHETVDRREMRRMERVLLRAVGACPDFVYGASK